MQEKGEDPEGKRNGAGNIHKVRKGGCAGGLPPS